MKKSILAAAAALLMWVPAAQADTFKYNFCPIDDSCPDDLTEGSLTFETVDATLDDNDYTLTVRFVGTLTNLYIDTIDFSTGLEFGRNFDSDYLLWTGTAQYKLTSELAVEYSLERLELDPDPQRQSTWIHVVRANQFFTKDLFLRLFLQTNSAIERNNVQAVFVYRYLPPFGTVQLAYQRGTSAFGQRSEQGNTLFLKATTVF